METSRTQDSSTAQSNGSREVGSESVVPTATTKEPSDQSVEKSTEPKTQDPLASLAAETPTEPGTIAKVQAVRGPRHQTGGVQRPKLTEDELSARMAAAALNNARREAAHREAEADAAKFEAREAAAKQRRVQETASRRVMDSERERNRQRKLGAQGVREWDQGKDEGQAKSGQSRREYHSTAHRAMEHSDEVADNANDSGTNYSGRGRGRGRGGSQRSRGGGRGNFSSGAPAPSQNDAAPSLGDDHFPALATNTKASSSIQQSSTTFMSPIVDKGTWAEQVEASQ